MSEAKFTKGEWAVDSYASIDNSVRVMQGNILISYLFIFDDAEEVNANAHLIAAAPEMYKALKSILDSPYTELQEEDFEMIEKTLSKAKGEV